MARWPGKLPSGIFDDRPTMTFDLTASMLAAAGCQPPEERPLDGIDVLGKIAAGKRAKPRVLFWRARRADRTWKAVRERNLKYVYRQDDAGLDEYLFDLSKDPGESTNLIGQHKIKAAILKKRSSPETGATALTGCA